MLHIRNTVDTDSSIDTERSSGLCFTSWVGGKTEGKGVEDACKTI